MTPPTFTDVLQAQRTIRPHLSRTPLHHYPALDGLIGTEIWVKHENYQPVGAFKVRGGINYMAHLAPAARARGVITASTGNHGQSIAYAARLFGIPARIVVPQGANAGKVAAIEGMGAEVIHHGAAFDEARGHGEHLARTHGYCYVNPADEPLLVAGVATETLELLEEAPDIQIILVPVGAGSGAAGASIVAHAINPAIQVIGVQSAQSPAAYESWRARRLLEVPNRTFAEGLATGVGFSLTQGILWDRLHDFLLVDDDAIRQAMVWMIEHAHTLAEGAGAAPLAAAYQLRDAMRGKKVGLICSGGNTSLAHLRQALDATAV